MKLLKISAYIFATLAFALCANAQDDDGLSISLIPQQEGRGDVKLTEIGNGEWEVELTGDKEKADPFFFAIAESPVPFDTKYIMSVETFSGTNIGTIVVFVGQQLTTAYEVVKNEVPRSEGWMTTEIDLSTTLEKPAMPLAHFRVTLNAQGRPGTKFRFRNLSVKAPDALQRETAEQRQAKIAADRAMAERLGAYLEKDFAFAVESVAQNDDGGIKVKGSAPENAFLAEIPMWTDYTNLTENSDIFLEPLNDEKSFEKDFSRFAENGRDRIISAWAVVEKDGEGFKLLSPVRYIDEDSIRPRASLERADPHSLKSIACPIDHPDLRETGIGSKISNVIVNAFFFTEPAEGRKPFEYNGKTYYYDENNHHLKGLDKSCVYSVDNSLMMAGIILIQNGRRLPDGSWHKLVAHPDAYTGSPYTLPNLENKESLEAYAAMLNFLAERYSRPGGEFGRMHNWIMHNEINAAFFWTSAGDKSLLTYLNYYQKSMRIMQIYARLYDPNAKALISLDHDWTNKSSARVYPGKTLLEYLVKFSQKEGDFDWGIAYHPYAENIFNARVWEDKRATLDFDTPFMTFKNLEVLDTWAKLPQNAYKGKVMREVQLTEQGVNSPDYSEKSLADQAAGVAFMLKKVEPLTSITVLKHHNWADSPDEGGLLLGLRKVGAEERKPAWFVYRDYETPDWKKWDSQSLEYMGYKSWDEIHSDFGTKHPQVTEGGRSLYKNLDKIGEAKE